MPNMSQIIIIGHLGDDPELKYTNSGTAICNFAVAVNTGYRDNKITTWYQCALFGSRAELLNSWAKRGQAISVTGEHWLEVYTKKDGTKGATCKINASNFELINTPADASGDKSNKFNDDMPF